MITTAKAAAAATTITTATTNTTSTTTTTKTTLMTTRSVYTRKIILPTVKFQAFCQMLKFEATFGCHWINHGLT